MLAGLAPLVAGCGFTPLYATPGLPQGLSAIQINVQQGRVPYLLREDLDDALGHDKSAAPAWRLDVAVVQTRTPKGLNLQDVAERYEVGLKVSYTLTEVATNKVVHTGEVTSQVSYDEVDAPYAGIAARQDTQERAASDAARRIQIELATWMARHRTTG
jgi:LPS-assembly lipoprotein